MCKAKILVVDDERFFTNLLYDILKDKYHVSVVNSGTAALEKIQQQHFDLVLLDILMPDIDGYEVCRQIKLLEHGHNVAVIFLSVKNDEQDELTGFKLGAVDYITKPISLPIVLARVATQVALVNAQTQLRQHSADLELLVSKRTAELNREITKKQKAYEKLHYLANYDQLTQLPNRNLFNERLAYAYKLAKRNKTQFSLLLIDLDRFKQVNDSLGHHIGDLLLEQVGVRLSACLRGVDTIARLGGDEFTVILTEITKKQDAAIVAEKILESLGEPFNVNGQTIHIGASIGIASYPEDGEDFSCMLKNADLAMYEVKEKGKNAYAFFSAGLTIYVKQRMELDKDLRHALINEELYLQYQPIIDLSNNAICGVEALLRWHHPKYSNVATEEIISIAEDSDLILELGEWVLTSACRQFSEWRQQGLDNLHIAINMSTRQFCYKADSNGMVAKLIQQFQIPADALQLEITESLMLEDSEFTVDVLQKLKQLGLAFSVDDFGTGYSSLGYLRRFPIDILKIDKSFIQDLPLDSGSDALVKAIIAMAQCLNLRVIAEGVETQQQLEFLQRHGCDMVQGYYFSRPVSAAKFELLMAQQQKLSSV
ncbi:MAG: diguanylate cyclase [Methyloprofundus sp.]|nr:MAG: diguanylate cyclase [Methyloprofundus sp.]